MTGSATHRRRPVTVRRPPGPAVVPRRRPRVHRRPAHRRPARARRGDPVLPHLAGAPQPGPDRLPLRRRRRPRRRGERHRLPLLGRLRRGRRRAGPRAHRPRRPGPLGVTLEGGDAVAAAGDADLVVLALTEPGRLAGEVSCCAGLRLPGNQVALVHAVVAVGAPLAVIMTNGRPLVIGDWWSEPNAVLSAWHLGATGPEVVADVLTGALNPSGRLPMSFPRTEGQLPAAYDAAESTGRPVTRGGAKRETVLDAFLAGPHNVDEYFTSRYRDVAELGPELRVGHGLSYSGLEHEGPALSQEAISLAELAAGASVGWSPGCSTSASAGTPRRPPRSSPSLGERPPQAGESPSPPAGVCAPGAWPSL
ncbi:glycoside hydrolase family 3 C-terminal domain-containing protein [Actinomyces radicidentis]|uniref:glycoside hydrolase family 3 C-terminal domain-containing protein n=1 Tax=Actinomyces radicidentis TaxID=111015 RepID=UPI0026DF8B58|nr:glycoside hydrolase family 3 C-terminal domain-containing protein [Actinomyces radicidentis]